MRISKFKVKNYVSFYDENAEDVELGPGVNFIVGKNNSGKTALLDALSCDAQGMVHLSIANLHEPRLFGEGGRLTEYEIAFSFQSNELSSIFQRMGRRFYVPYTIELGENVEPYIEYMNSFLLEPCLMSIRFLDNTPVIVTLENRDSDYAIDIADGKMYKLISQQGNVTSAIPFEVKDHSFIESQDGDQYAGFNDHCWALLAKHAINNIYRFSDQRLIPAKSSAHPNLVLRPDCENLAQVLHTLSDANPGFFQTYTTYLQQVFPEIRLLRFPTDQENNVELIVQDSSVPLDFPHLDVSLSKSGTGFGQVMAMLYVVVTSSEPKVILIDEPQSFLHPGALRDLLAIFQENGQHQYIMTTHSPTAIMSIPEKTIVMLDRKDMKSEITTIDLNSNDDLRKTLETIGTRPSDVFGMDNVIWVEGKTDATCFPIIAQHKDIPLGNARFLALDNASNLTGRDAQKVLQIYQKLSQGGLLPRALAFVFDGDSNDKVDCDKTLTVEVNDTQHEVYIGCLKRRNFESYFLDVQGFADIVSAILNDQASQEFNKNYSSQSIRSWMDDNRASEDYFKGRDKSELTWLKNIDGARFLENMFGELSNYTLEYDKAVHGRSITVSILESEPEHFQEIVDLIQSILDKNKTPVPV